MAEFPALPLFTDAFIADTIHLNAQQTGAYLMLLMAAWRSSDCRLPDDDKILARYSRMDLRSWNQNKDVIMSFWKRDDQHKWYQSRLDDERKYAEDKRSKNVAAGKASALKRHVSRSTTVPTEPQHKLNEPITLPKPLTQEVRIEAAPSAAPSSTEIKSKDKKGTRLPDDWTLPDEYGDWAMKYCASRGLFDAKPFIVEQGVVFKNYWTAKTSQATKRDWKGTWENWIRRGLPDYLLKLKRMEREKSYELHRRR